jgi:hypothetical protein
VGKIEADRIGPKRPLARPVGACENCRYARPTLSLSRRWSCLSSGVGAVDVEMSRGREGGEVVASTRSQF